MDENRHSGIESLRAVIEPRDLALVVELPLLFLISWLIPKTCWMSISSGLVSAKQLFRRDLGAREKQIGSLIRDRVTDMRPGDIVRKNDTYFFLERLQLLRMYRPDGWNPNIRLEGSEHIVKAIDAGNGAILWVAPSSFHRQVSKMAFMQAGYRVNHLSRYEHGFNSASWFGGRCLNPIRTMQEERYLNQRLVIGRNGSKDTLKRLEKLLQQNRIVSITVGRRARRTCQVEFLNGKLVLPTGPAFLSHKTKAPLLPVFTVRESHENFTTRIEPPLNDSLSVDAGSYIEAAIIKYAALVENHALEYPAQFLVRHGPICL